ncbi:hypothetical protein [Methylobacterium sp. GC_Met_2]|uniref:hypothetical protein n=1 Tax=Methylobacterium sp. GC_Met_2 TaxID=2937376 RepID=UPI00226BA93F|nr:hypothetical protein [Methylobacterium sp. GC_Met_2]
MKTRHPGVKAAVSNGSRLHLLQLDGRTLEGRRFADLVEALTAERGGYEALDTAKRQAIRMYAQLAVERERIEGERASGKAIDSEAYGKLCDRADRQYRRMGPVKAPERPGLRDRYQRRSA